MSSNQRQNCLRQIPLPVTRTVLTETKQRSIAAATSIRSLDRFASRIAGFKFIINSLGVDRSHRQLRKVTAAAPAAAGQQQQLLLL